MAVHLGKIYTRTGDDGTTSLVGGVRISKADPQVESYGTSDELNANLGMLLALARSLDDSQNNKTLKAAIDPQIAHIQNKIFDIGSLLATPADQSWPNMPTLSNKEIEKLETQMDLWNEDLEPLKSFTLPGSSVLNAQTHLARTVCRRLERCLIRLNEQNEIQVSPNIIKYVNRLSDYLFTLSRWTSKTTGEQENLWVKS